MGKICGIYKITSPSGKIYIGQSVDIHKRRGEHKNRKAQTKLYYSIKKHGWENHVFEIIHECSIEDLNNLEKCYVDLYSSFNSKYGLNLKDGGGSTSKFSEETKKKKSLSMKGKTHSPETKEKLRIANTGKKMSILARQKMRAFRIGMSPWNKGLPKELQPNFGRNFSEEVKKNMKEAQIKYRINNGVSDETRKKISKTLTGSKASNSHLFNQTIGMLNSPKRKGSSSVYKGVCAQKNQSKGWVAFFKYNGKSEKIGYFDTEVEAALAWNKRVFEIYGDLVKPNVII